MHRSLASRICMACTLLFAFLSIALFGWSAQAGTASSRDLDRIAGILGASIPVHCEIPCGIYDDHAMVKQMLLDAETIRKASAQIGVLSGKVDAQSLNTISRWVLVKEEHSRNLQHVNAWYFMTQRVKAVPDGDPGYALYLEKLTAHHAISVNAMSAAQSLDPAVQEKLAGSIKRVAPWYPPSSDGAQAHEPEQWRAVAVKGSGDVH